VQLLQPGAAWCHPQQQQHVVLPPGQNVVAIPYYNIGFNVGPNGRAMPGDPIESAGKNSVGCVQSVSNSAPCGTHLKSRAPVPGWGIDHGQAAGRQPRLQNVQARWESQV
jgi:hypothetical protein